jgi:hypothetical protein
MSETFPMLRLITLFTTAVLFGTATHAQDTLLDPTRPVSAASQGHQTEGVRVQAILDRDGHRVAIVAGEIVRAGDRRPWGQVEEVTATGIRYVVGGKTRFSALEVERMQVRRAASTAGDRP